MLKTSNERARNHLKGIQLYPTGPISIRKYGSLVKVEDWVEVEMIGLVSLFQLFLLSNSPSLSLVNN